MNQRKLFGITWLLVALLLVGSLFASAGVVYAFGPDTNLSNADASFWGEDSSDRSGHSVASAGDVNGDSHDDFLIGAFGDEEGAIQAGQTYLILGRAAADWGMDFDLSNADASFWGEDSYDYSGWSVASAGDVNGDGRDDFLIGTRRDEDGGDHAGQTYLILGRAAADWGMDFDLSNADASFWGEDAWDYSGDSVASAGDVNGDGRGDFLIGAWGDDDGGSGAGQTYLILGRAAADWGMDFDLSNADASFWGEDENDFSGDSVASAGDVNGDGHDDFLIGAWGNDDGADTAGQTYLLLGTGPTPIETATGTGIAWFNTSTGTIEDLEAVAAPSSLPHGVRLPHGMFNFKITGLADGESATMTVEFPDPIPTHWVWWKYHDGTWSRLPIGRTMDPKIITVTFVDGGAGDSDDIPGQITDPGGPGDPGAVGWETYPASKVRVLLPWIALLAAIVVAATLLVLRRRRTTT